MGKRVNNADDIKLIVMNPECIPAAQEKMFEFFYERFMREQHKKEESSKLKDAK